MISGIKPTDYHVQIKIFEAAGCTYVRTRVDHLIYHYPGWSKAACCDSEV
jgi:hypothetical protein